MGIRSVETCDTYPQRFRYGMTGEEIQSGAADPDAPGKNPSKSRRSDEMQTQNIIQLDGLQRPRRCLDGLL